MALLSSWEKVEQAFVAYQARCLWQEEDDRVLLVFQSRQDWRKFLCRIQELGIEYRGSYHAKELILYR